MSKVRSPVLPTRFENYTPNPSACAMQTKHYNGFTVASSAVVLTLENSAVVQGYGVVFEYSGVDGEDQER